MKLKIAGSGGMFLIPNPFCKCPVCQEARIKRGRYERLGPSLYIEDIGMLIDTPEDIAVACDRQGISRIDYLSISHKDPDHTRGMRIVEPLGYDCIAGKGTPIQFIALPEVVDDINAWNGDGLYYYQNILNCISINRTNYAKIGSIELHLVNNKTHRGNMTFYVISDGSKKAVYACCDVKPFVPNELYYDADVLIIGGTSLTVYPAAGLIDYYRGSKLVLINKSVTSRDGQADLVICDSIGKVLGDAAGLDQ